MIQFGTGGWRAIIGDGFIRENVVRVACALAKRMQSEGCAEKGLVIGYDRRFLSREAAQWAAEVLAANGVNVQFIRYDAPTPLVMFTMEHLGVDYGMAVTASHNPALYNGIKVFTAGGRDAQQEVTDEIAKVANALVFDDIAVIPYAQGVRAGSIREINPMNPYIDSILKAINVEAIRERELKVVVDPMHGVSRTALQMVLVTARCDVSVIHESRDALFGGRLPAPSATTLDALTQAVVSTGADIGIATDGDADRLGIIDCYGRYVHANEILSMLYYYLLKYRGWKGPVVRNVATTHLLDRIAAFFGEKCIEVPVGFKHISSNMDKYNAIIGGESSGGLTVRGHIHGKDGIYAAALLVEMIAVTGKPLHEIYKEITDQFGRCAMAEHAYEFDAGRREEMERVVMNPETVFPFDTPADHMSYMDGLKVYWPDGWLIVRFSGTEPLLRIFCEMPTIDRAEAECRHVAEFLGLDV